MTHCSESRGLKTFRYSLCLRLWSPVQSLDPHEALVFSRSEQICHFMGPNVLTRSFLSIASLLMVKIAMENDTTYWHFVGNALGYQAPGVGRDPSQSPKIWDHLQVSKSNQISMCVNCWEKHQEIYQATYGDLVRLDLPRNPPTVLVFHPHLAEQASKNSPGRAGK